MLCLAEALRRHCCSSTTDGLSDPLDLISRRLLSATVAQPAVQVSSGIPGGLYLPIVPRGDETSASAEKDSRSFFSAMLDILDLFLYTAVYCPLYR